MATVQNLTIDPWEPDQAELDAIQVITEAWQKWKLDGGVKYDDPIVNEVGAASIAYRALMDAAGAPDLSSTDGGQK